jgi:hypothetical protein
MPTPEAARIARWLAGLFALLLAASALAVPPPPTLPPLLQGEGRGEDGSPATVHSPTENHPHPSLSSKGRVGTPRIGLVTMEPGEEYWSRYGHNAILVDDGVEPTLYNYGYFDFAQPGFLVRFLRGRMLYRLVALPAEADLANYAAEGRGVTLQWLALPPERARELAQFLAWNARPENADYRYDYFTANCSTKVRDALDRAFGGALQHALSGRSHGYTYRDEARRLAAPLPWLYLGSHLGLGPFTDRPLSLWEESFVPMRLREALDETRIDGQPVVAARQELLPHRLRATPAAPPEWRWGFAAVGVLVALLLAWSLRPASAALPRKAAAAFAAALWLGAGMAGLGLLALWCCTEHVAAWGNENALLFNPLCLLLLGAVPALCRGPSVPRWLGRVALLVAFCAGVALFLKFLPFRLQANGDWIALMLPIHVVLAWRLARGAAAP